jgi:hypothetical protein
MRVSVGDVRLFVDVDGASLVPDGEIMRERPILLMLHGGPGFDHTPFKQPFFSPLSEGNLTLGDASSGHAPGSSRTCSSLHCVLGF